MIVKKAEGRAGGRPAGRGHSFKSLAAYLLDPKEGEAHRVLWSAVENLGTDNGHMAARVMAATSKNADAIRANAGGSRAGRKSEHGDVYHLVMSWAEDETPTPEHQQDAARALLRQIGMERAQVLMAAHDDNGKPHVHLMVNLVDPETGKRFSLSNDQRAMSDWALAYEKAHGGVRCQQRADNAERRAKGENTKDAASLSRAAYEEMQATARTTWAERRAKRDEVFQRQAQERTALRAAHDAEWKAHRAASDRVFRAAHSAAKAADKAAHKPVWRQVFAAQRSETGRAVDAVNAAEARLKAQRQITTNTRRLVAVAERLERSFLARRVLAPLGLNVSADGPRATLADALTREAEAKGAVAARRAELAALPAKHEAARKALSRQISAATLEKAKAASRAVDPQEFTAMIERQAREKAAQIEAHNAERQPLGMKPYAPTGKARTIDDLRGASRAGFKAMQDKAERDGDQKARPAPKPHDPARRGPRRDRD